MVHKKKSEWTRGRSGYLPIPTSPYKIPFKIVSDRGEWVKVRITRNGMGFRSGDITEFGKKIVILK